MISVHLAVVGDVCKREVHVDVRQRHSKTTRATVTSNGCRMMPPSHLTKKREIELPSLALANARCARSKEAARLSHRPVTPHPGSGVPFSRCVKQRKSGSAGSHAVQTRLAALWAVLGEETPHLTRNVT